MSQMAASRGALWETCDVARRLGVSPERVRQLANEGRLPVAVVTARGVRLFEPDAVERFQAERQERQAAPK